MSFSSAFEDEFLVVLHDINRNDSAKYFDAHLQYLTASYPNVQIRTVYRNLVLFDYLCYSAFLTEDAFHAVTQDPRVKLVETIGAVQAAALTSYVSFEDEDGINGLDFDDGSSKKCAYDYSIFDRIEDEQASNTTGAGVASALKAKIK